GDDDVAGEGVLEQFGIHPERGVQEGVGGDEQDHEFRGRVEGVDVVLRRELGDVGAQQMGVPTQVGGVFLGIVGVQGIEVGDEGHLRVDNDAAPAGQVDHQVGADDLPVQAGAELCVEVTVADHAAQLDDPLQLDLSPPAADLRGAQGGDELVRAVGQAGGG